MKNLVFQHQSVLGPLLFLILLIDINFEVARAALESFADDTRIWGIINSIHDISYIQDELRVVYQWASIVMGPTKSTQQDIFIRTKPFVCDE